MARVVQISLEDRDYAEQLCQSLRADPTFEGCRVVCGKGSLRLGEIADGVQVMDLAQLRRLPQPLRNPFRTVLIASGAVDLERVWEAGVVSVLQYSESLEYVKLAILAALLRPAESGRVESRTG